MRNKFKNVRRSASGPAVAANRQRYGHAANKRKNSTPDNAPSAKRKMVLAAVNYPLCVEHMCKFSTDIDIAPQGNQELLVVRDKVGRPQVSIG